MSSLSNEHIREGIWYTLELDRCIEEEKHLKATTVIFNISWIAKLTSSPLPESWGLLADDLNNVAFNMQNTAYESTPGGAGSDTLNEAGDGASLEEGDSISKADGELFKMAKYVTLIDEYHGSSNVWMDDWDEGNVVMAHLSYLVSPSKSIGSPRKRARGISDEL
ncbi:hypothetical protein SERLA73DRAFT_155420 [Serpula lacrymans var. lacrymans S7.3]|uniref:Uncharacterized protein n=1 Tax=Serpula lacrymans var. lacrymans (strain S7.3) TaxID=936435 RepID=F8QA36_SERL3|nr:hypothetical protein SERLA73DRAFT_155420 [Serpula lacrymans var. lacrymans S7.3]